jgi:hypothetical protein
MPGSREWERRFGVILERSGLGYLKSPSVRLDKPVENRWGEKSKIVANPDYLVLSPDENYQGCYVEVTTGNGENSHKEAQKRVLSSAGLNFKIIPSGLIVILGGMESNEMLSNFLINALELNKFPKGDQFF